MASTARDQAGVPPWIEPMLAKPDGGHLPSGSDWAFEYKLDGYRMAMRVAADGTTLLTSRNGLDLTQEFVSLTGVLDTALDGRAAVFDGEIVAYNNETGLVDFGLMQERRGRYQKHRKSIRRDQPFDDVPVRLLLFDLLMLGGQSLLNQPYDRRRQLLTSIPMPDPYRISIVPAFTADDLTADRLTPERLLERVAAEGQEGVVAKHCPAPYIPAKRTDAWLKRAITHTQEVIICGWRPGQNRLAGTLGGLLLGAHDPSTGNLVYLGDVGTGFSERARGDLQARLERLERRTHPFADTPPREDVRRAHWVEPTLVGEVVYRQFTRGVGRLRHTAWRGLRQDKTPQDVIAPTGHHPKAAPPPQPPSRTQSSASKRITVQAGQRRLTLSNLDKVLYPATRFTKSAVIRYYTLIAPMMLPHLAGRPITTIRFPDGVEGEQFFEKNVPRGAPSWLPTARLSSSGSRGTGDTITYPLFDELAALVWVANLAALELHVPQWTVDTNGQRQTPDRLVFDLDPGPDTTIVECAKVAERLYDVLVDDGLTPVAKTSGSKGMQVYASVRTRTAERTSAYAKAIAQRFATETPNLVTAKMTKTLRTGKVFIDWSQNNPSKTTVAPYSLRGRDQPTVSTPITWDEVRACSTPSDLIFTADQVLDRATRLGDLFATLTTTHAGLP